MMLKTLGAWVAVVIVTAGTNSILATPSSAVAVTPPASVGDSFELMRSDLGLDGMKNQEDLNSFRGWLNSQEGIFDTGFYEAAVDIPSRTITLLWNGSSPLQAAAQREASLRGLTAVIKAIPYTKSQVDRAVASLPGTDLATPQGAFHVTSAGGPVLNDDRLAVAGYFTTQPSMAAATSSITTAQVAVDSGAAGVAASVSSRTGMDALVTLGSAPANFSTRSTDTSAFNAGGMMRGTGNSFCTSGFGIWINGTAHTTTARHCNHTPYAAWSLASSVYGSNYTTSGIGLASVLTGAGLYWMFDGTWDNSAGYHKTVNALADVSLGSHVCESGANSGVHCNLVVDQMNESFNDGLGGAVTTIRVHQATSGQIAGAQGDSGGPIFIPNTDGLHVWAVGMLQGSNETLSSSCGSLHVAQLCSEYIEFTSERTIINSISGASLRTG